METLQNEEEVALVFRAGIDDTVGVKRQRAAKPANLLPIPRHDHKMPNRRPLRSVSSLLQPRLSCAMSRPPIQSQHLNAHLCLSECHPDSECRFPNWWIYDKRAGGNLAMRAPTRDAAFVSVIEYWSKRSAELESELVDLRKKVAAFVAQVAPHDEDTDWND